MGGNMILPDLSRFAGVSDEAWRSLGLRLREIGLTGEAVDRVADIGEGLPPALREPLRDWHLGRMQGPAAYAMRLFVFAGTISASEASETLEDSIPLPDRSRDREGADVPLLSMLFGAGLLVENEDRSVTSPFHLSIASGLYLFSDHLEHGGEAVMGPSENTALLCRAAYAGRHVGRVLDLGCGAGTVALLLARHAANVIASDINPRALTLARINAAVNGIPNVEFREGDGFAPLAGESFELIACQPPFVPRPPDAGPAPYLFGGTRGDEIALRVLSGVGAHLTPQGRAVMVAAWPERDDCPMEARIAAALPAGDVRALHLRLPATDVDYQCAMYAAAEAPCGDLFRAAVRKWRDHFEQQGIRSTCTICTAIQRDPHVPAWNATLDVSADSVGAITGAAIDRCITSRDLLSTGRDALLAAKLHLPRGAVCAKEYKLDDGERPKYVLRLPESTLAPPVEVAEDSLLLMSLLSQESTVRAAVERFAAVRRMPLEETLRQVLPAIEGLLLAGAIAP